MKMVMNIHCIGLSSLSKVGFLGSLFCSLRSNLYFTRGTLGLRPPVMSASGRTSHVQAEEACDGSYARVLWALESCLSPAPFLRSLAHGQKMLCQKLAKISKRKAAAYMFWARVPAFWLMPCLKMPPSGDLSLSNGHREINRET